MYERLTDRARQVMQLANQEAQRFHHEYIGTEHILLGLVQEGSGVAANVLNNRDIDLPRLRLEVEKIVQIGPDAVRMGKLPQTPRTKKVLEYAIEEARSLQHNYVGTEHLLLGLLREQEGLAAQVLLNLELKLEDIREEVLRLLGPDVATRLVVPASKSQPRAALEFDLHLPLYRADGTAIESHKMESIQRQLHARFGGYLRFTQKCEGRMHIGPVTLHKEFIILRIISETIKEAKAYFVQWKDEVKSNLQLEDVLILVRKVEIL